jgi:hypothetical protein
MGFKVYLVQPWFAALGHPAQSTVYTCGALRRMISVDVIAYLPHHVRYGDTFQMLAKSCNAKIVTALTAASSSKTLLIEGTLACMRWLAKQRDIRNSYVFFLDASPYALLLALWLFPCSPLQLSILLLVGPERYRDGHFGFIKWSLVRRLLLKTSTRLLLRTPHLAARWKKALPAASSKIDHVASIECAGRPAPVLRNVRNGNRPPMFVVTGQIRAEKSICMLAEMFGANPNMGSLHLVGHFVAPELRQQLAGRWPNVLVKDEYIEERDLGELLSTATYNLMLYRPWDHDMESAMLFQSAYYQCPVVCFAGGWLESVVSENKLGVVAQAHDAKSVQSALRALPPESSQAYCAITRDLYEFTLRMQSDANVAEAVSKICIDAY